MAVLIYILISVFIISIISLVGALTLFSRKKLDKLLFILVAFAAGSLLATVFFDLIPELHGKGISFILIGIVGFFLLEAAIHWHHNHSGECEKCLHPVVFLNLFGDGVHNFLDGIIIAAGFLVGIDSGIAVTLAIALHEIPQELGDFAVLVKGGLKKSKALFYNFLSACLAIVGGIVGYFFLTRVQGILPYAIGLAAGGFLYIASSDIFPELHKEKDKAKVLIQILSLISGIMIILLVLSIFS